MKISFIVASKVRAKKAFETIEKRYASFPPEDAEVLVVLGGDGFMLKALRDYFHLKKPFYGINMGHLGFLMNTIAEEDEYIDLQSHIEQAHSVKLFPLQMDCKDSWGNNRTLIAFNDVAVTRASPQAAKLKVSINNTPRLHKLIADGVLVSTPAGSTAYNASAGGPILPIKANLLALTPISPFRPKNWKGALLKNNDTVIIETLESKKRPVNAVADMVEIRRVSRVEVHQKHDVYADVLFNPQSHLEERIIAEQF